MANNVRNSFYIKHDKYKENAYLVLIYLRFLVIINKMISNKEKQWSVPKVGERNSGIGGS